MTGGDEDVREKQNVNKETSRRVAEERKLRKKYSF
jgi:hypothetical protein